MNGTELNYISDQISDEIIEAWKHEFIENILIVAGTNAGKSYFIKNRLYEYCKRNHCKILYLVPRKALKNQFLKELKKKNKLDVITVTDYQALESIIKRGSDIYGYLQNFDYIVNDEFHYFTSDASYNKNTIFSLNAIIGVTGVTKIWLSATADKTIKFLEQKRNVKFKRYDFEGLKKTIHLATYKDEKELDQIVDISITEGVKTILFTNDLHYGVKLLERYGRYATFNCSETNYYFYKYVNKSEIKYIEENEKFKKNILITSTAMDCGLNICDDTVNNVIIHNIHDIDTIVQCIGRKRVMRETDSITVYIPEIENSSLRGYMSVITRNMARAHFLKNHTVAELIEEVDKHSRKYSKIERIVYDSVEDGVPTKAINDASYFHFEELMKEYKQMITLGTHGFRKLLMQKLGIAQYEEFDGTDYKDLACYLESMVVEGKSTKKADRYKVMKSKADKDKFIDRLKLAHKDDYLRDLKVINGILESFCLPYRVDSFLTSTMVKSQKKSVRAWKVIRIS